MGATESFITQNSPPPSPPLLVWCLTPFRAGWQQESEGKVWKEAGHTFPRERLFILPFTFCSHFTGTDLNYGD